MRKTRESRLACFIPMTRKRGWNSSGGTRRRGADRGRSGPRISRPGRARTAFASARRSPTSTKMNAKPFKLSGFDWDYGGRVTDWRGGVLGKPQPGGCNLGIEFVHPEDAAEENLTKVSGDREFLSDNAD